MRDLQIKGWIPPAHSLFRSGTSALLSQTTYKPPCGGSSTGLGWLPARSSHSPLGAVWVTRMALPILIGVLEYEAVGPLQTIRTFFHTVWTILEMEALCAVVGSLESVEERNAARSSDSVLSCCTRIALAHTQQQLQQLLFPRNRELPAWFQPLLGSSRHINPGAVGH